ncbi:MAG: hypothetical protein AAGE84_30095 [Cyanobacteria bacterium P01_G01_bin.39]
MSVNQGDTINWSFDNAEYIIQGIILGFITGFIFHYLNFDGFIYGTVAGTLYPLGLILRTKNKDITETSNPNEGIWKSLRNGLFVSLIVTLFLGMIISIARDITAGIIFGLILGTIFGLRYGGLNSIKHLILRLIFYKQGNIPWDYAQFLDYVSERLLMKKVGGGYVFYHRILMEHFANTKLEQ